jgi:hypothetical protein
MELAEPGKVVIKALDQLDRLFITNDRMEALRFKSPIMQRQQ